VSGLCQGSGEMIDFAKATGLPFSAVLKLMRTEKGISARSLSTACGLSPSYISKIESGGSKPPVDTFVKIAKELELNDVEILFLAGCE